MSDEELKSFLKNKSHTISFRKTTEEIEKLLNGDEQLILIHEIPFTIKRKKGNVELADGTTMSMTEFLEGKP